VIRIPIPALNEERRKEYVKLLSQDGGGGSISIRHARREGNEEVKALKKDGEISDDDAHRKWTDEIQKLTDEYIGKDRRGPRGEGEGGHDGLRGDTLAAVDLRLRPLTRTVPGTHPFMTDALLPPPTFA
jgi:hypothetical protein